MEGIIDEIWKEAQNLCNCIILGSLVGNRLSHVFLFSLSLLPIHEHSEMMNDLNVYNFHGVRIQVTQSCLSRRARPAEAVP